MFRTILFPQIRMKNLCKIAHLTWLSTGFVCGAHRSQSSASIAVLSDEPFDAGTELRYAADYLRELTR